VLVDARTDTDILGLDIGSVAVKAVRIGPGGAVLARTVVAGVGNLAVEVAEALGRVLPGDRPVRVGVTGQGRIALAGVPGVVSENEILCLVRGVDDARIRSVIEVGGHVSRWIAVEPAGAGALPTLRAFAVNDQCAAGAGAFLTQQAGRLRLDVAEFGRLAASAASGASVAGRCAVFAKSDMIHLQQRGTPVDEIAYGLCQALVRNFVSSVLRGREVPVPVLFVGGGALNAGLARAFREILSLDAETLRIPEDPLYPGARGAAILAAERGQPVPPEALRNSLSTAASRPREHAFDALVSCTTPAPVPVPVPVPELPFDAFLGIDLGSVSTDFALLSPDGRVLDGIYLPTRGRPIDVLREGLSLLASRHGDRLRVRGLGTTGSGRHLAARLLGADLVRNEITAQLTGTLHVFPDADTVFEIGGQDAKYIRAERGRLKDFTMNKVCAAGTGSFLEEQCDLLGLDVKKDFAALAFRGASPCDLGSRCTVFMESELVRSHRSGSGLPDLAAGLALSVARNYLDKVVGSRTVGERVVFQGGVASNAAVVAAFERLLGRPVSVHPFNGISGAVGAALLAREAIGHRPSSFRGLDAIGEHTSRTFLCRHCPNRCEVAAITVNGARVHFGDACERYSSRDGGEGRGASGRSLPRPPDLFAERESLCCAEVMPAGERSPRGVVGFPRASIFFDYLPFWNAFFCDLGFSTRLSEPTTMRTLEAGARHLTAETCLPIKMTFGHVSTLIDQGVDHVFLPSLVAADDPSGQRAALCPYTQAVPFMARAAMKARFLTPEVAVGAPWESFLQAMLDTMRVLGLSVEEVLRAWERASAAQAAFVQAMRDRGREVLSGDFDAALVVLGRPYNLGDPFLNLNLARHLSRLGILAIPQSFLPVENVDLEAAGHPLPWRFTRDAMAAAITASRDPRLYPVLVTNFGCGPDAFLHKHLANWSAAADRPLLVLEFDEHRGEAGLVTRLEAFLDQVVQHRRGRPAVSVPPAPPPDTRPDLAGKRVYLPYFSDHVYAFAGAVRSLGLDARVLPPPDASVQALGESVSSGKECHAYTLIAGDLMRLAKTVEGGDPVVIQYPGSTIPCLLSQFPAGQRLALAERGIRNVSIFAPASADLLRFLGMRGATQLYRGLMVVEFLQHWLCEHRPYELEPGSTDRVHEANLRDLLDSLAADDSAGFLARAAQRMAGVAVDRSVPRPVVGVAGDIYTRVNHTVNLDLWRQIEAAGCEVWPAPFLVDNVGFGLRHELAASLRHGRYPDAMLTSTLLMRKGLEDWRVRRRLGGGLSRAGDPGYREILEYCRPYIGQNTPEALVLNVAKMVEFAARGAHGVINAICLNCMIGSASAALVHAISRDHGDVPMITLTYAGSDDAAQRTKLETFLHQVKAFAASRPGPAGQTRRWNIPGLRRRS
jgi:predicted CoA-substrate-specific enzyme activase